MDFQEVKQKNNLNYLFILKKPCIYLQLFTITGIRDHHLYFVPTNEIIELKLILQFFRFNKKKFCGNV